MESCFQDGACSVFPPSIILQPCRFNTHKLLRIVLGIQKLFLGGFFGCAMVRHVGSSFSDQGSNPCPLHWKCGFLTTELPGKSLSNCSLSVNYCFFILFYDCLTGFPGKSTCNVWDPSSVPGSRRSSGEGIGCPLQSSWASLVAQVVGNPPTVPETWVWSLGWEDPLEKGTATHSSILAWRIPWIEEPGGLQSMGSQRAGHDWATFHFDVP